MLEELNPEDPVRVWMEVWRRGDSRGDRREVAVSGTILGSGRGPSVPYPRPPLFTVRGSQRTGTSRDIWGPWGKRAERTEVGTTKCWVYLKIASP